MSRVGKKPIPLPGDVQLNVRGRRVDLSGPAGKLGWDVPQPISVSLSDDKQQVCVVAGELSRRARELHGLSRALIANMVTGVSKGFEKRLQIYGTGYGCKLDGNKLLLNLGFMGRGGKDKFQFALPVPDGLKVTVEVPAARGENEPAKFTVRGCDRQMVGQFAADVRRLRPPEPYKGKGVRYENEHVRRKQGKALAAGR